MFGYHRDEYIFTTAVAWTAAQVMKTHIDCWNIETTFEEMRPYLGLETIRAACTRWRWCCTSGCCGIAAWVWGTVAGKQEVTFSDALTVVRRWLRAE